MFPNLLTLICDFGVTLASRSDPSSIVEFSDMLYNNNEFFQAIMNALRTGGIFVAQVGIEDNMDDPPSCYYKDSFDNTYIRLLTDVGFKAVFDYSESHAGFEEAWGFYIAFDNISTKKNWYSNQVEVDLEIRKRMMSTVSPTETGTPFRFFDGATMMEYQFPDRVGEELFCRSIPTPRSCLDGHGFDPYRPNVPITSFEV